MHTSRLAAMTRSITVLPSRRDVLHGLAGGGLGLALRRTPGAAGAKKNHQHKHKKPKLERNDFGCVDVGSKCAGNDANCCSGVCEGKKPKKGKKDTSVCVAHDNAGICFPDTDSCTIGEILHCDLDNPNCLCARTTGNGGFCGDFTGGAVSLCRECSRDTDCQDEFGPGAACVVLQGVCTSCPDTGRTACVPACA
jgi:hypothetical protein